METTFVREKLGIISPGSAVTLGLERASKLVLRSNDGVLAFESGGLCVRRMRVSSPSPPDLERIEAHLSFMGVSGNKGAPLNGHGSRPFVALGGGGGSMVVARVANCGGGDEEGLAARPGRAKERALECASEGVWFSKSGCSRVEGERA